MSIIRVNKDKNFVVMSNYHFKDKNLSLKAKGLLSQMLSLPENWDYTISGLTAINKENESAIKSALKELKTCGYLIVTKILPNESKTGRIEYIYDIYEQPIEKQGIEKQGVENQGVVFQGVENPGQYNIYKSNIDNQSIDNKTSNIEGAKSKRFVPPTIQDVKAYCIERNNRVDPERFVDYYTANGWHVGKQKMKDWRAAVRTWEKNGFNNNAPVKKGANGITLDDREFDILDDIL